jgi:hypothetical protein
MTKLDEMWAALAAYQPQADAAGHGQSWAKMCSEKTAYAAAYAAYAAAAADVAASYAADASYAAAADVAAADRWAQKAIDRIKKITTQPAAQPAPVQETKKSIVEALEAVAAYFYDGPVRNTSVVAACEKALNELAGKEIYKSWTPKDQAKLEDIEQYRMQMAGISTAAIGYWKEGDSIHPDYDTTALRDVAKLYARYAALYTTPPAAPKEEHT